MPPAPDTPSKTELRRLLRHRRNSISEVVRRQAGRALERLALHHRLLGRGRRIGFYVPTNGELNILPLLNRALFLGVHCYLPVLPGRGKRKLWFSRMGLGPHWALNRYGIPEYAPRLAKLRVNRLERVFMPMLGFDMRGYRMGMGGGYYDASLAFLRLRRSWRQPRLIGVGFEAQRVDRLPNDAWDIPMHAAITERGYYRFPRQ